MALKQTTDKMKNLLAQIMQDIKKSEDGNKAAAQRVRTGTIRLEKIAKLFRKESIRTEKQTKGKKKPTKKAVAKKPAKKKLMKKPVAKRAAAPKRKVAKPKPKPKTTKKKTTTRKTTARARALSFKRKPTAKLPIKRRRAR